MRTVNATLRDAMITGSSYRMYAKMEVLKSRVFFSAFTRDFSPNAQPGTTISATPTPQDVCYSSDAGGLVTAYVRDGKVRLAVDGDDTEITPHMSTDYLTTNASDKPSIIDGYIFFVDTDGNLKRATVDMTKVAAENDDCVDSMSTIAAHTYGSVFAFSATQCAFITIEEGGIRPYFYSYSGSWTESKAPWRFMFPATTLTTTNHLYKLVFSAAILLDSEDVFIYVSNPETGGVEGIVYGITHDEWSDTFEALPADLSYFYVSNAQVTPTGKIILAGQFQRSEDDLGTGQTVRNMIFRSDDGFSFSMDRNSLFSNLGYRFHVHVNGSTFYGSDENLVVTAEAPYDLISSPTDLEISQDDIISVNWSESSHESSMRVDIANNDYAYDGSALLVRGATVKMYFGYAAGGSIEWIQYGTYIISALDRNTADGAHSLGINMMAKGLYLVNVTTYPLYTELTSRQAVYDDLDELDNMYVAADDADTIGMVSVDFWAAEEMALSGVTGHDPNGKAEAFEPDDINGSHTVGFMSKEIKDINSWSSNPTIDEDEEVTVQIYGWCRTHSTGLVNDAIEPVLIMEDSNGELTYLRATDSTDDGQAASLESSYDEFPQDYYDDVAGSVPVEWKFTNGITAGDTVIKIGIILDGSNKSKPYIERVDITGLDREAPIGNKVWNVVDDGLQCPDAIRPHIMFSQKPTFDKNFAAQGKFSAQGDYAYYGLVGLANDAANYVVGRINMEDDKAQICKVRDGELTVLAESSFTAPRELEIYFSHKDGYLYFSYFNGSELYPAGLATYEWEEADGRLSMSDDEIRHVGIYGFLNVPFFEITDFEMNKSEGIGFLPGQPQSRYTAFPSTGILMISENEYEYISYTNWHAPRGPFQLRNFYEWELAADPEGNLSGWAVEFTWFNYDEADQQLYENSLVACSTGHSWLADGTCWNPQRSIAGSYQWVNGDRSRWYSNKIEKFYLGSQTKVWVTPCFYDLRMTVGENTYHSAGNTAKLKTNDEVICHEFSATGGHRNISLGSILSSLCAYAGAKASFPGNYEVSSYNLSSPGTSYEI